MSACPNRLLLRTAQRYQSGMTLIEVLVALLILAIGLMGAAQLQLNALKYTDSARMTSQASFIAYDMLDRVRANASADYTWDRASLAQPNTSIAGVRDLDLHDFETNIIGFAGDNAKGSVAISGHEVTISISWEDARAANNPGARETFTLSSRVTTNAGAL